MLSNTNCLTAMSAASFSTFSRSSFSCCRFICCSNRIFKYLCLLSINLSSSIFSMLRFEAFFIAGRRCSYSAIFFSEYSIDDMYTILLASLLWITTDLSDWHDFFLLNGSPRWLIRASFLFWTAKLSVSECSTAGSSKDSSGIAEGLRWWCSFFVLGLSLRSKGQLCERKWFFKGTLNLDVGMTFPLGLNSKLSQGLSSSSIECSSESSLDILTLPANSSALSRTLATGC